MKKNKIIISCFIIIPIIFYNCESNNTNDKDAIVLNNIQIDSLLKIYETKINNGDTIGINKNINELYKNNVITDINYLCRIAKSKATFSDIRNAMSILDKALLIDQKNAEIYYTKGLIYSVNHPLDSVIKLYSMAVIFSPDSFKYLYARALIYDKMGKYSLALGDAEKIILLKSHNIEGFGLKAAFLHKLEQWQLTIDAATIFINLVETNKKTKEYRRDNIYYVRSASQYKLNNFKAALKDIEIAIKIQPNIGGYYTLRGLAKNALDDLEGSYQDFKKAAELGDPEGIGFFNQMVELRKTHQKI